VATIVSLLVGDGVTGDGVSPVAVGLDPVGLLVPVVGSEPVGLPVDVPVGLDPVGDPVEVDPVGLPVEVSGELPVPVGLPVVGSPGTLPPVDEVVGLAVFPVEGSKVAVPLVGSGTFDGEEVSLTCEGFGMDVGLPVVDVSVGLPVEVPVGLVPTTGGAEG